MWGGSTRPSARSGPMPPRQSSRRCLRGWEAVANTLAANGTSLDTLPTVRTPPRGRPRKRGLPRPLQADSLGAPRPSLRGARKEYGAVCIAPQAGWAMRGQDTRAVESPARAARGH